MIGFHLMATRPFRTGRILSRISFAADSLPLMAFRNIFCSKASASASVNFSAMIVLALRVPRGLPDGLPDFPFRYLPEFDLISADGARFITAARWHPAARSGAS